MTTVDDIFALIRERGAEFNNRDLGAVEAALEALPDDVRFEAEPWIWESLALVINDPDYRGDCEPIE